MTADQPSAPDREDTTEDRLLDGRVVLRQPRRGHRAGTDAVLLAHFAHARPGDHVVDLGSASGAVGLMIAVLSSPVRLTLIDREPDLVGLAEDNIRRNGLVDRARALRLDAFWNTARWAGEGGPSGDADLVVTNPPYFMDDARGSPEPRRRSAHVLTGGVLPEWIATASRLLKPRGRLAMVHRADHLALCLAALRPALGSISLQAVHTRPDAPASRILISAVKTGRAPLTILSPLILHPPRAGPTARLGNDATVRDQGAVAGQPARSPSP